LPFIGEVEVAGNSTAKIKSKLMDLYAKVFKNPEIMVLVPDYLSQIRELKVDLHTASRGLSRLVTVRPDGYTTFPMVGEFEVGGRTIAEVSTELNLRYAEISPSLQADLFLEQHSGSVFYALGEVNKLGAHTLSRPISLLEAVSLAEGHTDKADIEEIIIFRRHQKEMIATRVNMADMLNVKDGASMFYIYKDDIVYIPESGSSQMAKISQRVADIILFRGWNARVGVN